MTNKFVELEVWTDASQYALGRKVLASIERNWRPVASHSHKFISSEANYSTTKYKVLVVINCLGYFCHSLLSRRFHVCADYKILVYYFGMPTVLFLIRHISRPSCMDFYLG